MTQPTYNDVVHLSTRLNKGKPDLGVHIAYSNTQQPVAVIHLHTHM